MPEAVSGIKLCAAIWELTAPALISDSPSSLVYRAKQGERSVIVKILKTEGRDEIPGMDFLRWRGGRGAVDVLAQEGDSYLLEDGGLYSIRSFYDECGDREAIRALRRAVRHLHEDCAAPSPPTLVPLERHFQALLAAPAGGELDRHVALLPWARHLARHLLADQTFVRPLHGDVHHGNFVSPAIGAGWKAIDPKGLVGDPAYDFANIFGNPVNMPDTVLSAERCLLLAEEFRWHASAEDELCTCHRDVTRLKLLQYAAVHSVLSACWSLEGEAPSPEDRRAAKQRLTLAEILKALIAQESSR